MDYVFKRKHAGTQLAHNHIGFFFFPPVFFSFLKLITNAEHTGVIKLHCALNNKKSSLNAFSYKNKFTYLLLEKITEVVFLKGYPFCSFEKTLIK